MNIKIIEYYQYQEHRKNVIKNATVVNCGDKLNNTANDETVRSLQKSIGKVSLSGPAEDG